MEYCEKKGVRRDISLNKKLIKCVSVGVII